LKLGSENQLNVHDYLSILFCNFSLVAQSGWSHVTIGLLGVRRTPRVEVPGVEECENYWHLNSVRKS